MDKINFIILVAGGLIFLWFVMPYIAKGILNIGNVTGMILGIILMGYGRHYAGINKWIFELYQRRSGKVALVIVAVFFVVVMTIICAETVGMIRAAGNHPPHNTTAIVLGCRVIGVKPSRILEERLQAAYAYLIDNPECYCVLSGGIGKGEDISEAECMYRYLTEKGIAAERLLQEDKSINTDENLRFSKRLLEEKQISGAVTIITSEFHAYRAKKTAERLGLKSYSTPSRTFFLYFPTYYVRELYGILYYVIQ